MQFLILVLIVTYLPYLCWLYSAWPHNGCCLVGIYLKSTTDRARHQICRFFGESRCVIRAWSHSIFLRIIQTYSVTETHFASLDTKRKVWLWSAWLLNIYAPSLQIHEPEQHYKLKEYLYYKKPQKNCGTFCYFHFRITKKTQQDLVLDLQK